MSDLQATIKHGLRSSMGDSAAARPLFEEALADCRRVLGAEHALTLRCMAALATVLDTMGARAAARNMFEEALRAVRAGASVEATQAVECIRDNGTCCSNARDYPLAASCSASGTGGGTASDE